MSSPRRRKPIDPPRKVIRAKLNRLQDALTHAPGLEEVGNIVRELHRTLYPSMGPARGKRPSPKASGAT